MIHQVQKPIEVIEISVDVTRFAAAFFGYSNGDGISVDVETDETDSDCLASVLIAAGPSRLGQHDFNRF